MQLVSWTDWLVVFWGCLVYHMNAIEGGSQIDSSPSLGFISASLLFLHSCIYYDYNFLVNGGNLVVSYTRGIRVISVQTRQLGTVSIEASNTSITIHLLCTVIVHCERVLMRNN